ncbi:MAG: 3-phosphoshikimate 1-carboxyvinyltransferase, partial [Rhodothermales bacterium]|nr:3-phosphoshikimate 1-carboxyvinyltransferase [Rhodothermales bacterium]
AAAPKSHITLNGVGMNPTRSGAVDVLTAMGARITVSRERQFGGEPIADLHVQTSSLTSVTIDGPIIPNVIDEIPVLAVAATAAAGETQIRDASELRVKESDRIAVVAENLKRMGADIDEHEDGLTIRGGKRLHGATVDAQGDHRIAMAMAIAGLLAEGETVIRGANAASVSFPGFWDEVRKLAGQ